ncbi:MAG: hypothetical protein CMN32_01650 [Saprospirales bacterium]|nr:hypothetical protein [Saprospirales bacterium]
MLDAVRGLPGNPSLKQGVSRCLMEWKVVSPQEFNLQLQDQIAHSIPSGGMSDLWVINRV